MHYFSKSSSSVLSSAILVALIMAGCGENRSVTGADQKKSRGGTTSQSTELQAQPAPIQPAPLVATPTATPTPKVITTEITTKDKPATTVIIHGKDGRSGKDGQNACVEYGKTENFDTQTVPPAELMAYKKSQFVDLPYLPTTEGAKALAAERLAKGERDPQVFVTLLTLNQGNAQGGVKTADGSIRKDMIGKAGEVVQSYVQDSMVVFDVPLKLPARRRILSKELFTATLHLSLYKHSVDDTNDTESLCLLDTQTCSGSPFHKNMIWGSLLNPKFNPNAFSNLFFSNNLDAAIKMSGNTEWRDQLHIDLLQMLSTTGQRLSADQFLDMMYGKDTDPNQPLVRNLRFVISDDTRVNNTPTERSYLEFKYAHNGCKADGTPEFGTPTTDDKDSKGDQE